MKITIENHEGRLRLRWVYQDKRYTMSCGVSNDPMGQSVARLKASEIERDIQAGYFDRTLIKYKPLTRGKTATEISTVDLFHRFTLYQLKEKGLSPRSIETRYTPLERHLEKSLNIPASKVTESKAGDFTALQLEQVTNRTAKARLWLLQSCWEWAKGKYQIAESNPWSSHIHKIKNTESKRVKPFSSTEIQMILNAFKGDRYYAHYYPLVYFLFGTGCRFGEAVGLRWRNLADDFSYVIFCESVSRGHHRNTTKNGKSRTVILSPALSAMLRSHSEAPHKPNDLVFPSPKGKSINDRYFNRRAWKTIIAAMGIEYRKPYATRHSAISHAIANGANYLDVAEASGHNPRVMFQNYASSINQQSVFVEF